MEFKVKLPIKNNPHLHVFIGYDDREPLEWQVARKSILSNASRPISVYPLRHRTLRDIGLFKRPWRTDEQGIVHDELDTRPFSTQFAFIRFLVPAYANYLGIDPRDFCVFMDSDFVNMQDMYLLLEEQDLSRFPVWCVKHDYQPANVIKMDSQIQTSYSKKNWSSFMVFNRTSPLCGPTVEAVNTMPGAWLHGFGWLDTPDDVAMIGGLHEGWNFLPDHSEPRVPDSEIRNIHYTEASPLMKPLCKYSAPFNQYLRNVLQDMGAAL